MIISCFIESKMLSIRRFAICLVPYIKKGKKHCLFKHDMLLIVRHFLISEMFKCASQNQ